MALHKSKSRARSRNLTKKVKNHGTKKVKNHGNRKSQGKSTRIVVGFTPECALTESPAAKELSFAKKRIPSTEELQGLRSELTACIAVVKAQGAQQSPSKAPELPSSLVCDFPAVARNASASLAPSGTVLEDDEPSASLLATTALYRPTMSSEDEDDKTPASASIGVVDASFSTTKTSHGAPLIDVVEHDVDTRGAVDHNDDTLPKPPRAATQQLRVTFTDLVVSSQEPPVCPREHLSKFTKRMITLFTGRCRCCLHNIKSPGDTPGFAQGHNNVTAVRSSPTNPEAGPEQDQHDPPLRRLRSRESKAQFGGATPSLHISKQKRPQATPDHAPPQPSFLSVVSDANEQRQFNPYEGYYVVVPDIYQPDEVHIGFPTATPPKTSTSQELEQVSREPTALEVWDAHVARFAKYREASAVPASSEELAKHLDALEDVRAERLRYGTGHCFGALAGDVYPFYSGLIF
jgi:hypothetical protein